MKLGSQRWVEAMCVIVKVKRYSEFQGHFLSKQNQNPKYSTNGKSSEASKR